MLIQIHMLQNYAPSNLNRDDTGSPKDAVFGGHRRGRISSQCIKRSIRQSETFADAFAKDGLLAKRTKMLPVEIRPLLAKCGADETEQSTISAKLHELGGKGDDQDKTKILVFLTSAEMEIIADKLWGLYQEHGETKFNKLDFKIIEKAMAHATPRSIDVSMFGRMTTSVAFEDVHAAVQVAHAISTHAIAQEFDYFTAVDDLSGESGAGMIGDVEFNSSTYYKYFNIHWEKLVENLGGDVVLATKAVTEFVEAAAFAQPSGKQNSFAANNLPDVVLVDVAQKNVATSYANAFLNPVSAKRDRSLIEASTENLLTYAAKLRTTYGVSGDQAIFSVIDIEDSEAENVASLPAMKQWIEGKLNG